jgi:hypothetical protein
MKTTTESFACKFKRPGAARRSGIAFIYVALGMTVFLGIAAIVVDLGYAYTRRGEAQKAADSAAMAGAAELAFGKGEADKAARKYAAFYHYEAGKNGAFVETSQPSPTQFKVRLGKPEPIFFAGALGFTPRNVVATAVATYNSPAALSFKNNGNLDSIYAAFESVGPYGWGPIPPPPGKDGGASRGDRYSIQYCNDGVTPNPAYDSNGLQFALDVPATYASGQLAVEIFDPDSKGSYDEEQTGPSMSKSPSGNRLNKTDYSIIYTDPNTGLESVVTNVVYDPAQADYARNNGKWAQDLIVDLAANPQYKTPGSLKLRVKSLDGSSENGFYIRTGPPHPPGMSDAEWQAAYGPDSGNNGSGFSAIGHVALNFFKTGTARIDLGYVPASVAGSAITITRYDIEPGGKTILYKTDTATAGLSGNQQAGTPTGDGVELSDTIPLPANYAGGNWWVDYTAGKNDSSSWDISYPGSTRGSIRLIE